MHLAATTKKWNWNVFFSMPISVKPFDNPVTKNEINTSMFVTKYVVPENRRRKHNFGMLILNVCGARHILKVNLTFKIHFCYLNTKTNEWFCICYTHFSALFMSKYLFSVATKCLFIKLKKKMFSSIFYDKNTQISYFEKMHFFDTITLLYLPHRVCAEK